MSLVLPGMHGQRFQDRFQVADADPFPEQVLEDALQLARSEQPGHDLGGQRRRRGPDAVEQALDLLASQQLVGVIADDLAKMAGHDRRGIEDLAARQLGDLAAVGVDPDRRQARDRVDAIAPVRAGHQSGRRDRQQPARVGRPLADNGPADLDPILIGRQADLIVNPHLGHDQPELARHPLADRPQPIQQVAAAGRVGQADQAKADLQLERIDVEQVFHPFGCARLDSSVTDAARAAPWRPPRSLDAVSSIRSRTIGASASDARLRPRRARRPCDRLRIRRCDRSSSLLVASAAQDHGARCPARRRVQGGEPWAAA